jgi:hypothetical protein
VIISDRAHSQATSHTLSGVTDECHESSSSRGVLQSECRIWDLIAAYQECCSVVKFSWDIQDIHSSVAYCSSPCLQNLIIGPWAKSVLRLLA